MPRLMRFLGRLAIALAVAGVFTVFVAWVWGLIGGGDLSLHGWIAMSIGIAGTVWLAWLLMDLAFRSDREGWDDRVDNSLDPGRDQDD
ncbi:hypothetical protein ASG17_02330 [Brevundimonas sp. Leaf363]|uniref:hypothetical protein n=1 Tax=Brevundimonas sp. Leaf363 TaxID=1736353 RepID=UPI0006FBECAD|nr:hypothetical protein [Brevundimonas sp. Leaf363]KQS57573.1 hypothetical protein ASG17_02330 [Brevundimonas sp. Leaf363]